MYVVLLKFSNNKAQAGPLMDEHKRWISRGFEDGVFLLVGSIQPNHGGALLASNTSKSELEARVNEDPFVAADVVTAEITEIAPSRVDERLQFLLS